jgi:DNA-directed RNA polymerase subunit RPC12/RpoP
MTARIKQDRKDVFAISTFTMNCPNCGSTLEFDPNLAVNQCDNCKSTFTPEELSQRYARQTAATPPPTQAQTPAEPAPDQSTEHIVSYHCQNCGAQVETTDTTTATKCYYCRSPVILTSRLASDQRPDRVVPFAVDREKAQQILKNWLKKSFFVPRRYLTHSELDNITGVYLPVWVARSDATYDVAGEAEITKVWRDSRYINTQHDVYHYERQGNLAIQNLSAFANNKYDKELIRGMLDYKDSQSKPFQLGYLNGFFAETYNVSFDESVPALREQAHRYSDRHISSTMHAYNTYQDTRRNVDHRLQRQSYVLTPMWLLNYRFNDEIRTFAVDGLDSEVNGARPLDKGRAFAVAAIIGFVIAFFAVLAWRLFL